MITATDLMKMELNRQAAIEAKKLEREQYVEAAKAARLERAKINYEHAKENVIKLCEERIGTLIEENIQKQGIENFSLRLLVSLFNDELGNRLFKVATIDTFVPDIPKRQNRFRNTNREYFVIDSCDFCYKTFQRYLKKHGFKAVQERGKENVASRRQPFSSIISCNIINITLLEAPTKNED